MLISIVLIFIGIVLLVKGADLLVSGSSNIAKRYHIPEIIIGLTIVSIGTSMPELFVSLTSAIDNHSDISLGNVIGSNIANLLLILGISSIIRSIPFKMETIALEIPMCLFFTLIFIFFCNTENIVSRNEALILIGIFVLFITYTIFMAKRDKRLKINKSNITTKEPILKNMLFIIIGIVALKFGGDLAVDNAVVIAKIFKISEKIIGITILAIGTSLPEFFTSVSAALKGKTDIAIGNIIGSNIFNMLLIIGISAFLNPIEYNISYNYDFMLLIVSTVLLSIFPFIPPKNKMSRANGIVYLIIYVLYLGKLLIKNL